MARTLTARIPWLFRIHSWVLRTKSFSCRFDIIWGDFLFYIENGILCVPTRIASMRRFWWEHTTYIHAKEIKIPIMPPNLTLWLTLIGSNYPCLEHISIIPKVFEPLKFYCSLCSLAITSTGECLGPRLWNLFHAQLNWAWNFSCS